MLDQSICSYLFKKLVFIFAALNFADFKISLKVRNKCNTTTRIRAGPLWANTSSKSAIKVFERRVKVTESTEARSTLT